MVGSFVLLSCMLAFGVTMFLIEKLRHSSSNVAIYKLLTLICLVAIAFVACLNSKTETKITMLVAVVFSIIGNFLLELQETAEDKEKAFLSFGLSCDSISHVLYFFAIIMFVQNKIVTGFNWVILSAFVFSMLVSFVFIRFSADLKINYNGSKFKIWINKTLIMFMAISTICLSFAIIHSMLLAAAYVVLFVSSILADKQNFGLLGQDKNYTIMKNVLYFVSQFLIVCFAYFV